MNKGDALAVEAHVVRYARPEDYDSGMLHSSAFNRPAKDADGLSVTQLGVLEPKDHDADMRVIRAIMISRGIPLGEDTCFAELAVSDIIEAGREAMTTFSVLHSPSKAKLGEGKLANPAHAIINGLPLEGLSIGSLTSQLVSDLLLTKVRREIPGWI